MELRFEPAGPGYAAMLVAVQNRAFLADYERYGVCPGYGIPEEMMASWLEQSRHRGWLICREEEPVGGILVELHREGGFHLNGLCVVPEWQGQGIGSRAMAFLEGQFPLATRWSLETPADKAENLRFYRAHGFALMGEEEQMGVRVALMERRRAPAMDRDTLDRLAASLTGEDTEIVPYLDELLTDLFQLGSLPEEMLGLLRGHIRPGERVLDLGCGKGAVALALAEELKLQVRGVDLMPGFVDRARREAVARGLDTLCEFAVGDIRRLVETERGWDCAVYGAVGRVLGEPEEMLRALGGVLREGGLLLLDDAYRKAGGQAPRREADDCPTLEEWEGMFRRCGFRQLGRSQLDASAGDPEEVLEQIGRRVESLCRRYPDKAALFRRYLQAQRDEYSDLEDSVVGAAWLLQKKGGENDA